MATNGLISIVENDKVVMKIVAGSDGGNIKKVVSKIKTLPSPREAYEIALKANFGGVADLVVIDEHEVYHRTGEDISPLYRETFDQPEFNPRWEDGTAPYVRIIKI